MPIFEKNGKRVAFIHVPKVAGTSIETLFKDSGWEMHFHARHYDPYIPSPQHLTYEDLKKEVPELDSMVSFMVVRSPMARIRSEWQYQFSILQYTKLSFIDFVRNMECSLMVSKTYWDNHWRPQSDFMSDSLTRVFQMEKLSRDLPGFLAEFDIIKNAKIPHGNKSKRKKAESKKYFQVDQVTADRIKRIYKPDYDRLSEFGYRTDEIRLT